MTSAWKRILAPSLVALVLVGCGSKGPAKTDTKDKKTAEKSEPDTKAKTETTTPAAPTPAPASTPAPPRTTPPPSPSPSPSPVTPMASDTAAPPSSKESSSPIDRIPEPDKKAFTDYVIHTNDGQEILVKWYWKNKDKITFQRAGGEISLKAEDIKSIEGRKDTD